MKSERVTSKSKRSQSQGLRSCVLVLGTDDPATSAVAGMLERIGCRAAASASVVAAQGAAGNEHSRIYAFNDELLASAGSSRDDFAAFYDQWLQSPLAPEFFDRALALLNDEFGDSELFLLFDPSISPLLPFWTEALSRFDCAPKAVIVVRNPIEVGRSLKATLNRNEALTQMVWLRCMLAAEHGTRQLPRFFAGFEELAQGWERVLGEAQDSLHLVWPKPIATIEFGVAELLGRVRNGDEPGAPPPPHALLPAWLSQTFDILCRWSRTGATSADHAALDRIRSEFDVAANAFARVVRAAGEPSLAPSSDWRNARTMRLAPRGPTASTGEAAQGSDAATLKAMLQEQRRKATLLNAELEKQVEATEALEVQLIEAQAEIQASRARRKEMARVIANREAKIARVYEELAALQRHVVRSQPSAQIRAAAKRIRNVVGRASRKAMPAAR